MFRLIPGSDVETNVGETGDVLEERSSSPVRLSGREPHVDGLGLHLGLPGGVQSLNRERRTAGRDRHFVN